MKTTYNRYLAYPVKVRIIKLQEGLLRKGYNIDINGKRDKKTIKALIDFQSKCNIVSNGIVCQKTFECLDIR